MAANLEKQFLSALRTALDGQVIVTEENLPQTLSSTNMFTAALPRVTQDNFNLVIEPQGPGFDLEYLGHGAGMDARTAVVGLTLSVYYEHSDQDVMISVLLDIAWWISTFMVNSKNLGGSQRITVLKGDYAWGEFNKDDEQDNVVESAYMGVFVLPVVVEYRRVG